jgi:ABC-type multidrug transport system ATPase subunit
MVTCVYVLPVDDRLPVDSRLQEQTVSAPKGSIHFDSHPVIKIGRADDNDLGMANPLLAPHHAQIEVFDTAGRPPDDRVRRLQRLGGSAIRVNDAVVDDTTVLSPDDTIRIGSLQLTVGADRLEYVDTSSDMLVGTRRTRVVPTDLLDQMKGAGGVLVDALHLNKRIRKDVNLLQDICLHIRPGEFVVLVGLSGAGKSTLMDALAGYHPATNGHVLVDGTSLYQHFGVFRTRIGFVPQQDIVHRHLTVYEALDYAAQLRLPPGTTVEDRRRRVEEVMADLDLSERRDERVSRLSGGQLKRVSIGVELLTRPKLFFLDEPTSGLDPNTETGLMQLLRNLTDQGRTIILITHATKNVMLADKVIFMVRGGRIAWYGPPTEALTYFNRYRSERERSKTGRAMEFDEIYPLLEDPERGSAAEWAERYYTHSAYRRYIATPLSATEGPSYTPPPAALPQISVLRQLIVLSRRNLKLLSRDRFALSLMLIGAPLLAALDFLITSRHMFDPVAGDSLRITITTGTLAVNALLVGALSQMREIIKDADIYRRERLVNLGIGPYVFSKVWIAVLLAFYQALAWVGFRYLAVQMPGGMQDAAGIYLTVTLTVLVGMMMGLLASAIAPTEDSVPLIVALLIVPQVLFNGSLLPLPKLNPVARSITAIMPARWSFEALISASGAGTSLADDPGWQLPKARREALTDAQKLHDACLGVNIFTRCTFPGIRSYYTPAIDQPPPVVPAALLDSGRPGTAAQPYTVRQRFRSALNAYLAAYTRWQKARTMPVARAEGQLEAEYDNFGGIYRSDLVGHWLILLGMIGALIAAILGIQKAKDVL